MIYGKTEKRIFQYLTYLDRVKYTSIGEAFGKNESFTPWEFGATDRIFRVPPSDSDLEWRTIGKFPYSWGEDDQTGWFRSTLTLPESIPEGTAVFLEAEPGTDTLVFIDSIPWGAVNPFHGKVRLDRDSAAGRSVQIAMESWAGHTFPGYHPYDGPRVLTTVAHRQDCYPLVLPEPRILVRNDEAYGLYYDVKTLFETALLQNEGSLQRSRICSRLHKALLQLDFTADLPNLSLQSAQVREKIRPLLELENGSLSPRIYSVGNAHLDHAWLWPISETSRKCARTCANMTLYAQEYPEFRYLFSQPVQMFDLKKNYPAVFSRVKDAVKRGQWEPNGGMWVEADCNLTGGESLIRQFLLGHRGNKELFDYTGDTLWLPDVFGYTTALPQIMKGCGIEYFVTSKISWNDTTRFPYDLFYWEGLDGTRIPTHFIPTAYEGRNTPEEAAEAWNRIQHKDVQSSLLRSIGEGDGGGGTMRSDLEQMRRMKNLQGIPRNSWNSLSDSMKQIFSEAEDLPVYRGELYLELHRGTYTTQGRIKKFNRKLELALREGELLEARLFLAGLKEAAEELNTTLGEAWKEILTLQFHDILPGTSVKQVNEQALCTYGQTEKKLRAARKTAESLLFPISGAGGTSDFTVLNSLPGCRTSIVEIPDEAEIPKSILIQNMTLQEDRVQKVALVCSDGMSAAPAVSPKEFLETPFRQGENFLETPWYTVVFEDRGGISELTMKQSGRSVQKQGDVLNALYLCEDLPVNWDAWDIEEDYSYKERRDVKLISRETLSSGRIFHQIRQVLSVGKRSRVEQDIIFYAHTGRIDFRTTVDWQENHTLMRVNFPTDINTDKGFFDIPFGYAERETHTNRPDNRAQFEVCAHKWACIRDARLSAALLSDCKYGYRVRNGSLSLSLLRSPSAPDETADRGSHSFCYAFFPSEDSDLSGTKQEGLDLNIPLMAVAGAHTPGSGSPLISLSSEDLMIESVKVSEDRSGIVVRVWETTGSPLEAVITPAKWTGLTSSVLTDMLENPMGEFVEMKSGLPLNFRGFEVKTILFRKGSE